MPDARVQSAIDHWLPRFAGSGVDYNDFVRTTAAIERWEDWLDGWDALGDRHAELAREAEAADRRLTAAEAWLRAAVAYHFGKFVWVIDPDRYRPVHHKSVAAYYAAHRLLGSGLERVEVPLGNATMVGNLRTPDNVERPPLVVLVPGLDSTKEEFFYNEEAFVRRGMATFSLDGPGQGESQYDLALRHDYEGAVTATLDTLEARGDLDFERIGIVGVSMGGYLAPRAAAFEPRIRAVVAASGAYKRVEIYDALPPLNRETFRRKTMTDSDEQAREVAVQMDLEGVLDHMQQPALFITGDQDRLVPWQQTQAQAEAAPNGQFVLIEGGTHVVSNFPYLFRPLISDWMREQLA